MPGRGLIEGAIPARRDPSSPFGRRGQRGRSSGGAPSSPIAPRSLRPAAEGSASTPKRALSLCPPGGRRRTASACWQGGRIRQGRWWRSYLWASTSSGWSEGAAPQRSHGGENRAFFLIERRCRRKRLSDCLSRPDRHRKRTLALLGTRSNPLGRGVNRAFVAFIVRARARDAMNIRLPATPSCRSDRYVQLAKRGSILEGGGPAPMTRGR